MNSELRRRGIYLLPNLLTTAGLFAGFYAIVQAMTGRFEHAAVAIFIAMVFDGLDGRVARMTRTQSAFGAEYDSLSDMVSFGAAPALIVFEWAMKDALKAIQEGEYAKKFILEGRTNYPEMTARRRLTAAHPIEIVGEQLRAMMPWIKKNKLVDQTKN